MSDVMHLIQSKLKSLTLLLLGILTIQSVSSQENYVYGYVINNNNDTVYGMVDYRNWVRNPKIIRFKPNNESTPVTYRPADILEFMAEDDVYESGIVQAETSPTDLDNLDQYPELNIRTDTTFLLTLAKGTKSLYYYMTPQGRINYYIKQNQAFELLIYKKYMTRQNDTKGLAENKKYLGQLTLYLNDCESITPKISTTLYNRTSLSKLFKYYYDCTNSDFSFQKKTEKITSHFGALAGVSLSSLTFNTEQPDVYGYLVHTNFASSLMPVVGIYLRINFPKNIKKFSLHNELLGTIMHVHGTYNDYTDENHYKITKSDIKVSQVKINILLRYTFPIRNASIFLNGGLSNGISLASSNHMDRETKFFSSLRHNEGIIFSQRSYESCFTLGAGLNHNRLSFEIRYDQGNGISDYVALGSSTERIYFLFGFRINK